jgi:hypothetical protein
MRNFGLLLRNIAIGCVVYFIGRRMPVGPINAFAWGWIGGVVTLLILNSLSKGDHHDRDTH